MARGTIITLRSNRGDGRGFGFIAPDGGGPDLFFNNGSVEGALEALGRALRHPRHADASRRKPFDRLHVGQRVTFAVGVDRRQPHRACAEHVRPAEAEPGDLPGKTPRAAA